MTLQHSPGPWSYHGRTECIRDVEGNRIADLSMSRHHGDGHLFAAAPDMLRLLRVIASGMPELRWLVEGGELRAAFEETVDLVWRLDGEHSKHAEEEQ